MDQDLRVNEPGLYTRLQSNKQDHHDLLGPLKISSSPKVPKALAMVNYSSDSSLKAKQGVISVILLRKL